MHILLVSPEFPDTFWSFRHALHFIRRKSSIPPLGLLTVAALLPAEWEKRLADLNVAPLSDEDLSWADYVFVGAMVAQSSSARQVIHRAKAAGVPVVAGGPLFTGEPEKFADVDHLVLGEAEITLPRFLEDLARGSAQRVYATNEYADLRASPMPLWELADIRRYASMSLQFSRGCPYDCEFCNVTAMLGHRPRTKTVEQVLAELTRIESLGWRGSVFFVDDNLIGNKRFVKSSLLPAIAEWRRSHRLGPFYSQVSLNVADDEELLSLLGAAGFDSVFVGVETPEEDALASSNKKQNLGRDLVSDVKRIQRAGLEVTAGFIVGFDTDTAATFQRQFDFIQRSGIVTAMVGLLQAPAGTRLYARMEREGRLLGAMTGDNSDGTTNIVPTMSLDTLRERYRRLIGQLYSPRQYYRRVRTFLREYKAPSVGAKLDWQRLLAGVRSSVRLGLVGRERMHYWGLMFWTLVRRPRHLSRAITLAIYGYHFRRVSELHIQ